MADKNVNINPRYLTYNKDEVQDILDGVKQVDEAPAADSKYPVSSGGVHKELRKYTNTEALTQLLAGKQDNIGVANEADVRALVTDYSPETPPAQDEQGGDSE
ncbi:MAG: hypothetical protein IJV24_07420 [Prevotella sp.]|nr:hypothetical protein [Prevotella sp.]